MRPPEQRHDSDSSREWRARPGVAELTAGAALFALAGAVGSFLIQLWDSPEAPLPPAGDDPVLLIAETVPSLPSSDPGVEGELVVRVRTPSGQTPPRMVPAPAAQPIFWSSTGGAGRVVLRTPGTTTTSSGLTDASADRAWLEDHPPIIARGSDGFVYAGHTATSLMPTRVRTGSHGLLRQRLNSGRLPTPASVRPEAFVNALTYDHPAPMGDDLVGVTIEAAPDPLARDTHVLSVGLRARSVQLVERTPVHLTFLVDTSGSMALDQRDELIEVALTGLAGQLGPRDTVAVVGYADEARRVLPHTPASERDRIAAAVAGLESDGATSVTDGLELAYQTARDGAALPGEHQVVWCSDGDSDVALAEGSPWRQLIARQARGGIHLSTVAVGIDAFPADQMQALAEIGGGSHTLLDAALEARERLSRDLLDELEPVAREVSVAVDFDPATVNSWQLVGWGAPESAREGAIEAGGEGVLKAGEAMTALYRVRLVPAAEGVLAAVRLKARGMSADSLVQKRLHRVSVAQAHERFDQASAGFRMAFAAGALAEVLQGRRDAPLARIADLVRHAIRPLHPGDSELLRMIRKVAHLSSRQRVGPEASADIADVVSHRAGQVQYCYAESLEHRSDTAGELSVVLRVYSGTVADVLVTRNTTGDRNLEACVVRKLRRWHFDPRIDADVSLPFELTPA